MAKLQMTFISLLILQVNFSVNIVTSQFLQVFESKESFYERHLQESPFGQCGDDLISKPKVALSAKSSQAVHIQSVIWGETAWTAENNDFYQVNSFTKSCFAEKSECYLHVFLTKSEILTLQLKRWAPRAKGAQTGLKTSLNYLTSSI